MWGIGWLKKSKPMNLGIDVSHHNALVQWDEVAKDPQQIGYVFIKATEGQNYVDSALKFNATEARKAGLKIGYYHFATLNTSNVVEDATAEARFFISTILKCPAPDMPLVLDIESNKANVPASFVELWIKTFFAELEKLGYKDYLLYSYTPFLNANLPAGHSLGHIRLWLAAYVNTSTPRLPIGWASYYIWQYSAMGKIAGIKAYCDLNKFNKSA